MSQFMEQIFVKKETWNAIGVAIDVLEKLQEDTKKQHEYYNVMLSEEASDTLKSTYNQLLAEAELKMEIITKLESRIFELGLK